MHELSLAGGILQIAETAAVREGFRRVSLLRLAVGVLACVDVEALCFALRAVSKNTVLDGVELAIDRPQGRAFCFGCGEEVAIAERGAACPRCGAYRLQPTAGTELRVVELMVRDE